MTTSSMLERRIHALVAGALLLLVAGALAVAVAVEPSVPAFDAGWREWIEPHRTPALTGAARVLSVVGGPVVMVPLRVGVVVALAWRRRWLQLTALVGATVCSELCIGPLKALVDRPRPPMPMVGVDSPAFPSGHAIAASVTAIGLVIVLVPATSRRARWTAVAVLFAATMAMSRTYLGAHWATDVIAGVCIGAGWALVWPAALELARQRVRRSSDGAERDRTSAALGRTGRGLLGTAAALIVALHALRPDRSPLRDRLSSYAVGAFGPLMTSAFVALGLGLALVGAAGLAGRRRADRLVAGATIVAGVGMLASAIWPVGPDGSTTDDVHALASAGGTVALLVAAATSLVAELRRRRRPGAVGGLAIAALVLAALAPLVHHTAATGLAQRSLWAVLLLWVVLAPARRDEAAADVSEPSAPMETMRA